MSCLQVALMMYLRRENSRCVEHSQEKDVCANNCFNSFFFELGKVTFLFRKEKYGTRNLIFTVLSTNELAIMA